MGSKRTDAEKDIPRPASSQGTFELQKQHTLIKTHDSYRDITEKPPDSHSSEVTTIAILRASGSMRVFWFQGAGPGEGGQGWGLSEWCEFAQFGDPGAPRSEAEL